MKITAKTNKETLKKALELNTSLVEKTNKELYDKIAYANKMLATDENKVTRKDLVDLVKETMSVLGDKFVEPTTEEAPKTETPKAEPKAENSTKKLNKKKAEPKEEPKKEEAKAEPKEEKVEAKKSSKKSLNKKKEEPKKEEPKVESELFPQTLELGDTKYRLAPEIKTMDDFYKEIENDADIKFAFYWTRTHLKQNDYFNHLLGKPKSFPNDLDIATPIYVSEEKLIAYFVSDYTEACYNTLPEDFEEVDGIRYAGTMEFQIYKAI